jgi:hypothetical protein
VEGVHNINGICCDETTTVSTDKVVMHLSCPKQELVLGFLVQPRYMIVTSKPRNGIDMFLISGLFRDSAIDGIFYNG